MRPRPVLAAAAAAACLLVPVGCAVAVLPTFAASSDTDVAAIEPSCQVAAQPGRWDPEQLANAGVIVATGTAMGAPPPAHVVALMAAMQESGLRSLDYGDRDSLGLFQQRPSQGWGTPAQILDPQYAATKFYEHLLKVPGWQAMPRTLAAQAVQRSAYPLAYAKWEPAALELAGQLVPGDCPDPATGEWVSPLDSYTISAGGAFQGGFRSTGGHSGLDMAAPAGTPIKAAHAGIVTRAGPGGAYGNLTVLDHGEGVETYYAHQSEIRVTVGARVVAGELIGAVGSTGNSTGPHLHFEVRVNGSPVDPAAWLAQHGIPVR